MNKRIFAMFVVMATVVLGLAACGGGSSSGGASSAKDPSTIKVDSSSLGDILVDGSGRALYLFSPDGDSNTNSMKCDATCLQLWPPMKGKPKAGAGVDASLIGISTGEGAGQATYAGHPLYYYAKDSEAGDVDGQGIGKIWYVLDGKGAAVTKAPADTGGDSGGGY